MTFRLGLLIGGAAGYVLGTRAGRERFDQIQSAYQKFKGSEPAQKLGGEVRNLANQAGDTLETKATDRVSRVTERVRESEGSGTQGGQPSTLPPT